LREQSSIKMYDSTLISVIMSVYNGENYLREAVDSILAQTFTCFEFIIIDDGSTDGTANILREYQDERIILLVNNQNNGLSFSLNRGIDEARGKYIARMDSDDISSPDRFKIQVQFLDENPSIDVVGSWGEIIDRNSHLTGEIWKYPSSSMVLRWVTFFYDPIMHPSVMMRRRIFDLGNKYEVIHKVAQDYGLWLRLNTNFRFSNIQSVLLKYRYHSNSISKSRIELQYEAACRMSQDALSSYLGKSIPLEVVKMVKIPYQSPSHRTLKTSVCLLHQLYQTFRKDNSLLPSEIVDINFDMAGRLNQISYKNPLYLSSRFLRLYVIIFLMGTYIFDLLKNNHFAFSHKMQAIARRHFRRQVSGKSRFQQE
jgi:glycosyltransferase involved in cell wall biosynthesis